MSEYEQGRFAIPRDDDPGVGEPGVEEPSVDEHRVEEPSIEEPSIEEPSVDEPSVEAFLKKVPRVYSEPARTKGSLPKWHRSKLDRDIARRHGLQPAASGEVVEDITALI